MTWKRVHERTSDEVRESRLAVAHPQYLDIVVHRHIDHDADVWLLSVHGVISITRHVVGKGISIKAAEKRAIKYLTRITKDIYQTIKEFK